MVLLGHTPYGDSWTHLMVLPGHTLLVSLARLSRGGRRESGNTRIVKLCSGFLNYSVA